MASLNLNFNTLDSISKQGGTPLDFAFSASIIVVGAGGGGAASGTSLPPAGGGGAGSVKTLNVKIVPNLTYTVNQIGVSGSAGINTPGQTAGGNGTLTQLTYWKGPSDTNGTGILIASGGFGADGSGNGGASGDGFTGGAVNGNAGGGGAGSFQNGTAASDNNGGNGGAYLGGGGGSNATVPNKAGGAGGAPIQITVAGTDSVLYTVSGSGGTGGSLDASQTINPTNGLYGGGGGGASYQLSTSRAGASGGAGVVVVTYSGQPKMLITNGYTNYISGSNITAHYITESNGTFIFPYPYPWTDVTGSIVG